MLTESIFLAVVIRVVSCQIDGEFWWLNNDITKFKHGTIPPPTFDDVNELDTDETAKVVFKDHLEKEGKSLWMDKDKLSAIHFRDETELSKPFEFEKLNVNNKVWIRPLKQIEIKKNVSSENIEDEFKFVFPSADNLIWTNDKFDTENKETSVNENNKKSSNKISFTTKILPQDTVASNDKNSLLPENICTFIKKSECILNAGTLYETWIKPNIQIPIPDTQIICCILPITTTSKARIIFPDHNFNTKRQKRSDAENDNSALKQRNNLIRRKHAAETQKSRATTPSTRKRVAQKIANPDEYSTDPYWNIKNSNIRNPNTPVYQDPDAGSDYGGQSYGDDYTDELPQPGLIGLYSDHKTQSAWTHNKNKGFYYDTSDSVEEEEFDTSLGYSSIDPRRDRLITMPSRPFRPKPLRFTSSRVPEHSLQNPTITFHSNPDFQVLQGFKLLNLMRNKNRFIRKTADSNKECAENGLKLQNKPPKLTNFDNNYEEDLVESNLKEKLFNDCGKTQNDHDKSENGLQQGAVEFGSHPWVALVVLTKSEQNVLCYATIVHSRVAVSVADCVSGQSPGLVSIIAGVCNLDEDLPQSQRRMATITLDPDYTPGNLQYNLALLHWLRPLSFDVRIQPACIGQPSTQNDNCAFVGWGGYDQEMISELRWQRASILSAQNCNKRLSKLEVSDALCAAVQSRGTVTGVGGPLLCKNHDRWSAVGVAAWRNDVIIVMPLREWVLRNIISLRIQ